MSKARNLSDFISDPSISTTEIADLAVTHAKLHGTMDLSSKTVTLPTLSSLNVNGNVKLDGNYPVGTGNVALGDTALDSLTSGGNNTAVGTEALTSNVSGNANTAMGRAVLNSNTGSQNSGFGSLALYDNTSGQYNTAVGAEALTNNTTANYNNAVGWQSLYSNTTGLGHLALGTQALYSNTTSTNNNAIGNDSLYSNTTGNYNVALGTSALRSNTTASNNTAVGYRAGYSNTTGAGTFIGYTAGYSNTTSQGLVYVGYGAGYLATGDDNTAVGVEAMNNTTTGEYNTALGRSALQANTTASYNTAVGYRAGYSQTTGDGRNTFFGRDTGYGSTGIRNTFIGDTAGGSMTSGSRNTILGRYDGNVGGLDIRTSSNNIVLSDGDGNPRLHIDSANTTRINHVGNIVTALNPAALQVKSSNNHNGIKVEVQNQSYVCYGSKGTYAGHYYFAYMTNHSNTLIGSIVCNTTSTSYNTSSDHRLKENVNYTWDATTRLKQLKPARFNFIADADTTVDGFLAHEAQAVVPEAVHGTHNEVDDDGNAVMQGIDQSKLVPLLVKTIQELEARITALEGA